MQAAAMEDGFFPSKNWVASWAMHFAKLINLCDKPTSEHIRGWSSKEKGERYKFNKSCQRKGEERKRIAEQRPEWSIWKKERESERKCTTRSAGEMISASPNSGKVFRICR